MRPVSYTHLDVYKRQEFTAGIAHKEYNINLGLDILVDVTDFGRISYEEIYRRIVEYQS